MALINGIVTHTPTWVWILLGYLIWKGIKARQPGETTLLQLAIVPALLAVWSLTELVRLLAPTPGDMALWLLAALVGAALGAALVRSMSLRVDRARGVIIRPGDKSLLPLLLTTFIVKYAFGVMAAVAPDLAQREAFRLVDLAASGFFVGIFLGKFACYALRYARAPGAEVSTAGQ